MQNSNSLNALSNCPLITWNGEHEIFAQFSFTIRYTSTSHDEKLTSSILEIDSQLSRFGHH
uniref:Uncharacterized protein n=1 Tax=Arundo donax TaxID=35708 RepID=A0A0A9GY20_ARUDO